MNKEKLFTAIFTDEAEEQLLEIPPIFQDKITEAIRTFELSVLCIKT